MTDNSRVHSLPLATAAEVRATVGHTVRKHRGRTIGVAALFLIAAVCALIVPAAQGRIVDAVTATAPISIIGMWIAVVAFGALSTVAVTLWASPLLASLIQDVLAELREDVFRTALSLPAATMDDTETADVLSRVTGDVEAVAEAGGNVVPALLSTVFAIVTSLVALTLIEPWLALAGLACVPFYVLGTRAFLRRSRVVFREIRRREADRSQAVLEAVDGVDTHIALNEHEQALARVAERAELSISSQIEGARVRNRLFRWINGGEAVGMVALLAAGFALHANTLITVGMVTTAALVFHRLFNPIGALIFALDDIQRATIGLARLVGVINYSPPEGAETGAEPRAHDGVELRDVTFSYPTSGRGIAGVSLHIPPGKTASFVGTSGSGKSTAAKLIAGHYPPRSGTVSWAARPYYISQEIHQFRGSIAENLRLARPTATQQSVVSALAAAGANWAIPRVDDADGGRLDDGQIQQLAVARAILADPSIVILDEATADIGLRDRPAVDQAIAQLCHSRTSILIAHRLEQAAQADLIAVFDEGEVIQCGTHAALTAVDGAYARFWQASPHLDPGVQRPSTPTEHPESS